MNGQVGLDVGMLVGEGESCADKGLGLLRNEVLFLWL